MKYTGFSFTACFFLILLTGNARAISITGTSDAEVLAGTILGSGISIEAGTATYTGVVNQSGTFTDGTSSGLEFDSGIVLSTGDVTQIDGPNNNGPEGLSVPDFGEDVSTTLGTAGDADLDAAVAPLTTNDAAVLEFNFILDTAADLYFNFVFASEEYIDWINIVYNDVFGFFVDGTNIALVPGTSDIISVNSINPLVNSEYYINNVENTNGLDNAGYNLSFDGLTTTITASLLGLDAGVHSMKFAIADVSDGLLDSAVFIQAGTFSTSQTPVNDMPPDNNGTPVNVPEPNGLLLFGAGLLGLACMRKKIAS